MGRDIYLSSALATVAACTFGAYLIWKQSVNSQIRHSNNNEIVVIARNRRTETVAEKKAISTDARKSIEDHSQLKISGDCKTSVRILCDSEEPNTSEGDYRHGFSEVSKEVGNNASVSATLKLKKPVKEVIIETQEVMAEKSELINEVSDSESNDSLNNHKVTLLDLRQRSEPTIKVTPPDLCQKIGSENEVPDHELNNKNNIESKSEVYFKVNENINYSTIAVKDSSSSSGSEIEVLDFESNTTVCNKTVEKTNSEEDISRQEITLPDSSLYFDSFNNLSDHESNKSISDIAVVSENSGSLNQNSVCEYNETTDSKTVALEDQAQTSGSKNEVNNTESNDNATNNTVTHSDDSQQLQSVIRLIKNTEKENLNKMDFNRKRWRRNPMYLALKEGDLALVQSLLRQGASMDFIDRQGQSPTHLAAASGNIALLEMLVGWGGDLSKRDLFGYTPFHRAALRGHTDTIRWLYDRGGGYIMETSWAGWTALHLAAINGHYTTALQLLKFGAEVNAKDKDGWTPLYLAKLYKRVAVMKLLQSWGGTLC